MKLTRQEKDRIIDVLWFVDVTFNNFNYTEKGLCYLIDCMFWVDIHKRELTKDYIKKQIYPYDYVTSWLIGEHGIVPTMEQARDYRKRWVNHMIKELRK